MPAVEQSHAFAALYEAQYAFVWSVLRKMGVPTRDVEDLLQDVFVIVHRRLDEFEGRAAVKTWLYAIVVRVYWNYARRQRSQPPMASDSATTLQLVDDAKTPEQFAEQRQASRLLDRMLAGLDSNKRTAYVLAEIEGLSAPEIAAVTGANTRTIYSRLRAAKEQVDAGVRRVAARERGNLTIQQLASRSTERPPPGLQRRAWLALGLRLPLSPMGAPVAAAPWLSLKAVGLSLALGLGGVGVVAVSAEFLRPDPGPRAAPQVAVAATHHEPTRGGASVAIPAPPAGPGATLQPVAPETPQSAPPKLPAAKPSPRATAQPDPANATEDLALINQARRALKSGRAEDALGLLDRHRERFPTSQLQPEREKTRLVVLCKLGRDSDATKLGRQLGVELGLTGDPCAITQAREPG